MKNILYEDTVRYDPWLKFILGGVLAALFVMGVSLLSENAAEAVIIFGVTIIYALLFKAILPRRFQIFEDKLRIVLGGPLAINIALTNITAARRAPGGKIFAYWGIRFATSSRYVVEIVRRRGLNMIISPTNGDMFLEQLNQAMQTAGEE